MKAPHYKDVLAQISYNNKSVSRNYTSRYLCDEISAGNSRMGNYIDSMKKYYKGAFDEPPMPIFADKVKYSRKKQEDDRLKHLMDYSLN